MPNDAKLGLVVGVGVVIAVGVVFYRKDAPTDSRAAIEKVDTTRAAAPAAPQNATPTGFRRHTVQAGETLTSLAKRYLGDDGKAAVIRQLNPALADSEEPAEGTVLMIPDRDRADR
jgi:nucleoid-associated protein YgaU